MNTRKIVVTLFAFFIVAPNITAACPFTNAKKLITVIIPKLKKPAILLIRVILFGIFISIKNGNDVSSTTTNIIAIGRLKYGVIPAEVRTAENFSNVNN
jgi:lipoprotein